MVKGKMSGNFERKEDLKDKSCSYKPKRDDKILKEDKPVTGYDKNKIDSSVPFQDQKNYITKDEDNFSTMINGSY